MLHSNTNQTSEFLLGVLQRDIPFHASWPEKWPNQGIQIGSTEKSKSNFLNMTISY